MTSPRYEIETPSPATPTLSGNCYDFHMKTTLTLEDDLVATLREAARRRGEPLKAVANEALRAGLKALVPASSVKKPYRLEPAHLGNVSPGIDLTKALQLADALEDEGFIKKLELGQ